MVGERLLYQPVFAVDVSEGHGLCNSVDLLSLTRLLFNQSVVARDTEFHA